MEEKKDKKLSTYLLLISLIPLIFNWFNYGSSEGKVRGLELFKNPIMIVGIILFLVGVWCDFKKIIIGFEARMLGLIFIFLSEICAYYSWHNIKAFENVDLNVYGVYPAVYLGFLAIAGMLIFCWFHFKQRLGE